MSRKIVYNLIFVLIFNFSCVKDKDFDIAKNDCSTLVVNSTFQDLENLASKGIIKIQEDLIIEAYITSSDIENNFFGTLHLQDKPSNPTMGIIFHLDLRDYHLLYYTGHKIFIRLKGLYLDKKNDSYRIGGSFTSFGNKSVGRLPSLQVQNHIYVACNNEIASATKLNIEDIQDKHINTLIELDNLEVIADELTSSYAEPKEETERMLTDCNGTKIKLLNSGYADFQANLLPQKNGSIIAVLIKDKSEYKLRIRSLNDINFNNERCPEIITEFTSTYVFISEIADPNNNAGARFLELYNSSTEPISLNKWKLNRYTNSSTEISSSIDLSSYMINAKSTLVISPNATEFKATYGFVPDVSVGTNSPADSNGDDNIELIDAFGNVMDVFGVIGEDGSNTNHEFEDGKAIRKIVVKQGSNKFDPNEWTIFNDTGNSRTTNLPQNAPEDFSPGIR